MLLQNNIFYTWYIDVCINKTTLPQRGGSLKMCKKCFPLSKSLSVSVQRSSVENCKWAVIRPGSFSLLADAFDPIQALPVWGHSVTSLWVGTAAPLFPSATRFIVSWKFWLYKKKKKTELCNCKRSGNNVSAEQWCSRWIYAGTHLCLYFHIEEVFHKHLSWCIRWIKVGKNT